MIRPPARIPRADRGRRESGASAVEFALVMPVLFLLLFGIIDYGMLFFDSIGLRQGAREGARQAVVQRYAAGCTGTPKAKIVCTTKASTELTLGAPVVKVIAPDGWVQGKQLTVCVQTKESSLTGFVPFPSSGILQDEVHTVDRGGRHGDRPGHRGGGSSRGELVMVRLTSRQRRVGLLRSRLLSPGPEQGAVAVVVALFMIVLVMCAAVVVDLGNARDVRRQSQNASDASALAGASALYPTSNTCAVGPESSPPCWAASRAAVKSYAAANFGTTTADWTACSVAAGQRLTYTPSGESSCISYDSSTSPTTLRVYVPARSVSTFFGGVTGRSTIPVGSTADAQLGQSVKCSLCFLGSVDAGNGDFSTSPAAPSPSTGTWCRTQQQLDRPDERRRRDSQRGHLQPSAHHRSRAFGDPLAGDTSLPAEHDGALPPRSTRARPCRSWRLRRHLWHFSLPNSTCTLQPGLYVITGTWDMKNNTVLKGTGVTLYAKSAGGYLDFKNGDVQLHLRRRPAPTKGYAIIYDRNNTNNLGLQGNGGTSISGLVYAPASAPRLQRQLVLRLQVGPVIVHGCREGQRQPVLRGDHQPQRHRGHQVPPHLSR